MTSTDTRITCASPNAAAGAHAVVVTAPSGIAGPAKPLAYEVGLYADNRTRATPERGSLAGGTYITMVGDGFAEALDDNKVTIAGADCEVVEFFEDFHESLQPTAYPSVPPKPAPTMLPSHSSYVPTALPAGNPSGPPTSIPSSTPTSPWPTPAATNFTGFNYRSTLTCVTGPLPANATLVVAIVGRRRFGGRWILRGRRWRLRRLFRRQLRKRRLGGPRGGGRRRLCG